MVGLSIERREDLIFYVDLPTTFNPKAKDDFLLEIGSEELPATFVPIGCQNLKNAIIKLLTPLSYDSLAVFGTPRRLSILVKGLIHGTEDRMVQRRGPPVSTAFDPEGNVSKQGLGFFKSLGFETPPTLKEIESHEHFYLQEIKGKDYLMADLVEKGTSTIRLLSDSLPSIISNLHFPKQMRWAEYETNYARPLKWFVALLGNTVIPFEVVSIPSGRSSWGHTQLCPHTFEIKNASDYISRLQEHQVMVSIEARKQWILDQIAKIERETGTTVIEAEKVLPQVLHLSEWPMLTYGTFDESFLKIPDEILISEMVEHQKYFPLINHKGTLAPLFVITADNTPNATIIKGNQNVLSARLSDGVFLYEEDLKTPLDAFSKKLETIIFQKDLGSMAEKVSRVKHLALHLTQILDFGVEKKVLRAAQLSKADIATELVQEFPDLQGTIGKHYALHQNEEPEVALAIEEHWMPQSENGPLPTSPTGTILSLADKLDNLISYFSVGLKPTSSSDPYALRRQAIGIIKILIENRLSLDLEILIKDPAVLDFLTVRARGVLQEYGFQKDEIEAALQGACANPYDKYLRTKALNTFRQSDHFERLFEVYKRAKGQIGAEKKHKIHPDLFQEEAETALYQPLSSLEKPFKEALKKQNYQEAFECLAKLQRPLATLFNEVKILSDDPKIRSNRIALLQNVFSYFSLLLDFGKIQNI